jgi:hypothetical protein
MQEDLVQVSGVEDPPLPPDTTIDLDSSVIVTK